MIFSISLAQLFSFTKVLKIICFLVASKCLFRVSLVVFAKCLLWGKELECPWRLLPERWLAVFLLSLWCMYRCKTFFLRPHWETTHKNKITRTRTSIEQDCVWHTFQHGTTGCREIYSEWRFFFLIIVVRFDLGERRKDHSLFAVSDDIGGFSRRANFAVFRRHLGFVPARRSCPTFNIFEIHSGKWVFW